MENLNLIDTFSEFKEFKNIERETLMRILEDVFMTLMLKKYGSDENFSVIANYWNHYLSSKRDPQHSLRLGNNTHIYPKDVAIMMALLKIARESHKHSRDIHFNTRVVSAIYQGSSNQWKITTDTGECFSARFCVMATGNLSLPRVPNFKGLPAFKGQWYHTGQWPKHKVDFTGLRVGVIGTGSSAIQLIPVVAKEAKELTVFQRTANFSLPSGNSPTWVS